MGWLVVRSISRLGLEMFDSNGLLVDGSGFGERRRSILAASMEIRSQSCTCFVVGCILYGWQAIWTRKPTVQQLYYLSSHITSPLHLRHACLCDKVSHTSGAVADVAGTPAGCPGVFPGGTALSLPSVLPFPEACAYSQGTKVTLKSLRAVKLSHCLIGGGRSRQVPIDGGKVAGIIAR